MWETSSLVFHSRTEGFHALCILWWGCSWCNLKWLNRSNAGMSGHVGFIQINQIVCAWRLKRCQKHILFVPRCCNLEAPLIPPPNRLWFAAIATSCPCSPSTPLGPTDRFPCSQLFLYEKHACIGIFATLCENPDWWSNVARATVTLVSLLAFVVLVAIIC